MTQNLIINNDDDAETVKFTVEIPDGFASFKIDSINGTLINQDYLRVGDRLTFSFSNNPIVYNTYDAKNGWHYSTSLKLIDTSTGDMNETIDSEHEKYKFISLDLFNIYRVKYIPVYSYFDYLLKSFMYVFNPTDNSQLKDEPTIDVENYTLARCIEDPLNNVEAAFAGSFIIALQKVDNIADIPVIFGESISNSKTQFEDLGAINAAGEAVQENLASSAYTYGSAWRYNVSNLIMNHRMMVSIEKGTLTTKLAYFVKYKNDDDTYSMVTTTYADFNAAIVNSECTFSAETFNFYTVSDTIPPVFTALSDSLTLTLNKTSFCPFLKRTQIEPPKYEPVLFDENIEYPNSKLIPYGCKIKGSELNDANKYAAYEITYNNGRPTGQIVTPCAQQFDIDNDAYYSGNVLPLKVADMRNWPISNKQIWFDEFNPDVGYIRIPLTYRSGIPATVDGVQMRIQIRHLDKNQTQPTYILLGDHVETESHGYFTIVYSVNTGFIPEQSYGITEEHIRVKQPLQLTAIDAGDGSVTAADDDVIITHVQDDSGESGLKLSTPTLSNDTYRVSYDEDDIPTVVRVPPDVQLPPNMFLPMKSRQAIAKWEGGFDGAYDVTDGVCVVMTQDNEPCQELIDASSVYYLADGHETLNVEPAKEDDEKFKTFNGTVMFDRSAARITRYLVR